MGRKGNMELITASDLANKIEFYNYTATVDEIKKTTNWLKQSCAVVCDDDNEVFGVISESDILEAEKINRNLKAIHGWEICSHNLLSVTPDASVHDIITLMLKNRVHHILVRDIKKNGKMYDGIISTLDIVKLFHDKHLLH